tara:strand:+ start:2153 stop:2578 length:426 start_codon:yes stop_codon:yes gene_type:complete
LDALSLKIAVPPAAYNISVAVGLIDAIFSGTFSKVTSCPRASMTTSGSATLASRLAVAEFEGGSAVGADSFIGSGALVGAATGSSVVELAEETDFCVSLSEFESDPEHPIKINRDIKEEIKIKPIDLDIITICSYRILLTI